MRYDLREFYFTNSVVSIRNSLANNVVSADSVNTLYAMFKDTMVS